MSADAMRLARQIAGSGSFGVARDCPSPQLLELLSFIDLTIAMFTS